jgi:type 1 glutamine amidotransferase
MLLTTVVAMLALGAIESAPERIPVLLVTGHNNHNWRYTSRVHADTLEWTGRFDVDITDDPASALADAKGLSRYKVIVLDYNDSQAEKRWGPQAENNFLASVSGGTGVVVIHAANNAFKGWAEYEKMVGLLWREGTGHGAFHTFDVEFTDKEHPVTSGLPDMKAHPDELYHKLVNTQNAPFKLLGRAMSSKDSGGTGKHEPMVMTLEYGKGRVFHTPLGHVWEGAQDQKVSISNPQFRTLIARGTEWAATGKVTLSTQWADSENHNTLSEEEAKAGWKLLFDGKSTANFRGFKQAEFPKSGWEAGSDGTLRHVAGKGGGDIVTREQYGDFEFVYQWKAAPGANSGVFYRVSEDKGATYETGPEMQVLDNAKHQDGKNPKTSAGSFYGLYAPAHDVVRPAGEWNHAKIVAKGPKIEYWLNGFNVVNVDLAGDEFKKLLAESKFKDWEKFAKNTSGFIALQDHGDDVWFRGLKVRSLK